MQQLNNLTFFNNSMNVQDSLIASCKNCLDSSNIHGTLDITYIIYQQQQEEDTDQGNE
jgi:hypothetical protein